MFTVLSYALSNLMLTKETIQQKHLKAQLCNAYYCTIKHIHIKLK